MDQLTKSVPSVPPVQPPRSEGVSKRAILIIVLLVLIFYVANWISTKPLTRRPNLATPTFVAKHRAVPALSVALAEDTPGARWCLEYGGVFERVSPYIEICYFPTLVIDSNSSSNTDRR
jgi:hypothetical protein